MPDLTVLMPLLATIMLFLGAALWSRSLMLGAGAVFMVTGYVSVRSGNDLMTGIWVLSAFFMVMASGVFLTKTVMGETA